ncbi:MAG: hypothetical protein BWK78_06375 [Thiotrichaceae bacterium IS1]|nr:MAG: hypothetical protein BWK78_06375 [Thiotrichaceae bacterium IS1]
MSFTQRTQYFKDWVKQVEEKQVKEKRVETITEVKPPPSTELKQISRGMTFWKWIIGITILIALLLLIGQL